MQIGTEQKCGNAMRLPHFCSVPICVLRSHTAKIVVYCFIKYGMEEED